MMQVATSPLSYDTYLRAYVLPYHTLKVYQPIYRNTTVHPDQTSELQRLSHCAPLSWP